MCTSWCYAGRNVEPNAGAFSSELGDAGVLFSSRDRWKGGLLHLWSWLILILDSAGLNSFSILSPLLAVGRVRDSNLNVAAAP